MEIGTRRKVNLSVPSKGLLTEAYPLKNNFFLNLKFKNGVPAQVCGLYDVVEPYFQDHLDNDREPSPNVIDGAKACAVASAAWASSESGAVEKVFNDFRLINEFGCRPKFSLIFPVSEMPNFHVVVSSPRNHGESGRLMR